MGARPRGDPLVRHCPSNTSQYQVFQRKGQSHPWWQFWGCTSMSPSPSIPQQDPSSSLLAAVSCTWFAEGGKPAWQALHGVPDQVGAGSSCRKSGGRPAVRGALSSQLTRAAPRGAWCLAELGAIRSASNKRHAQLAPANGAFQGAKPRPARTQTRCPGLCKGLWNISRLMGTPRKGAQEQCVQGAVLPGPHVAGGLPSQSSSGSWAARPRARSQ